jgi:predicted porin
MKKHVLASIVAMSFATSAMAQVTVYGILDQALRTTKLDGGTSESTMVSGSYATSRIGLKGVEDLGNGTKVSFTLEGRLDGSNGTVGAGDDFFSREASVSLSTGAGTVTLGRTDTSASEGIDTFAGIGNFGNFTFTRGVEYAMDRENTVRYTSPNIAGATLQVGRSLATDTVAETDSASVTFDQGTFGVGLGYDKTGDDTYTAIGAKANLGVASVGAMFGQRDAASVKTDVMAVSTKVALGPTYAAHGVYKTIEATGGDKVTTGAVGLSMTLSKRTMILGVYQDTDKGRSAGSLYQVGLVHRF